MDPNKMRVLQNLSQISSVLTSPSFSRRCLQISINFPLQG